MSWLNWLKALPTILRMAGECVRAIEELAPVSDAGAAKLQLAQEALGALAALFPELPKIEAVFTVLVNAWVKLFNATGIFGGRE